jgi:hypothetical protein
MGIKGSWSRVKDHEAYRLNMEAVEAYEKKRRARLERAVAVTGGKVKRSKGE